MSDIPPRAPSDVTASTHGPAIWIVVACLLTALAYLPGLSGPFLLDDIVNLQPLGAWLTGAIDWQEMLLGNASGLFGRPVAMASFMLDARLFGGDPLPFKATNLILHLLCGLLLFALCRRLLERDATMRQAASWWALGISAVWLLHPIQVSTVLYIVQRMAQLSALCVLVALLCYWRGRNLLEQAAHAKNNEGSTQSDHVSSPTALAWLFLAFPLATLAATLSKENGVLAPLYALVLELCYFGVIARPRAVRTFFAIFLLLPGLVIAGWYATHPNSLLIGYEIRDFTLGQRLLSEPRALLDYVGVMLLPRGAALGLYGDDFVASTSLFSPASTLPAIVFWIVATIAAWRLRRYNPTFAAGVFLFLAGHAMESTVFALELYFEHRNYLPSIGVFLALAALLNRAAMYLNERTDAKRLLRFAAAAAVVALGFATHTRAWSWQAWSVIVTQAAETHPNSMRAQLDLAALFIKSGQFDRAYGVFAQLRDRPSRTSRNVGAIDPLVLDCQTKGAADPQHLADAQAIVGKRIGNYEITAVRMLVDQLNARPCENFSLTAFAEWAADLASRAPQNPSTYPVWTLRHIAADFFRRAGDLPRAQEQALAAWSTSTNPPAGLLLVDLLTEMKQYEQAGRYLDEVRPRMRRYDAEGGRALVAAETKLRLAKEKPAETSP